MMKREVYTFSPGPCIFPLEVLEKTKVELNDKKHSILEYDHNSPEVKQLIQDCKTKLKSLLKIPDNFSIIFMQGGATLQFAAVPFNLLSNSKSVANYIVNGTWSELAFQECQKFANANKVNKEQLNKDFHYAPKVNENYLDKTGAYFYYCDNETIHGVEFFSPPNSFGQTLVTDMTSNFLSKPIDFSKFGLVYSGAQKNWGPAGLCTVIIRNDLFESKGMDIMPSFFKYKNYLQTDSFYSLPPIFSLFLARNNLEWISNNGGVENMDKTARQKSSLLYDCIDNSKGFYKNKIPKESRSRMNVIFIILNDDKELTAKFIQESTNERLIQLGGHRSVGGLRASLYNGMPLDGVQKMTNFMDRFRDKYQNSSKL